MTPLDAGFVGAGRRLATTDITAAAARLGCAVAAIAAVLDVESAGSGFDAAGRPKILFEPHIFYRELLSQPVLLEAAVRAGLAYPHQGTKPYAPTSELNYQRLKRACLIEPGAAMRSASWGIAQVMGFNFAVGGYSDVAAMVQAVMDSESAGFGLLLGYLERDGLVPALRVLNFAAVARGYNGPGAVAAYAARLQAAYHRRLAGGRPPAAASTPAPSRGPAPSRVGATPAAAAPAPVPAASAADSLNDLEWLKIRAGMDPSGIAVA